MTFPYISRFRIGGRFRRRIVLASFALTGSLLVAGCCKPAVDRFHADQQVWCDGKPVVLHWEARGKLAMTVEPLPSTAGEGACASRGQQVLNLSLVAGEGADQDRKELEIALLQAGASEPVKLPTTEIQGREIVARGEKNVALWADHVSIGTVAACDHRALTVAHAGKTALLAANGAPSRDLKGTPLAGQWEIRSVLTPTERRVPPDRPKQLALLATLQCTNGDAR